VAMVTLAYEEELLEECCEVLSNIYLQDGVEDRWLMTEHHMTFWLWF